MNPTTYVRSPVPTIPEPVFDRILVGADGTPHSFDACRQAARLAMPDSAIEVATVSLLAPSRRAERDARAALPAAEEIFGERAEFRELRGLTADALVDEARRTEATLLAIGAPHHSRLGEIVLGSAGGELLHRAPCSVLLARAVPDEHSFPRSIVVGVDGSPESEHACEIATALATRFHSELHGVVALGGKHVDFDEIEHCHPRVEASSAAPVPALVAAAACADLLVLGSRGLHGLRALGSVSERVAHHVGCSVLVVRRSAGKE